VPPTNPDVATILMRANGADRMRLIRPYIRREMLGVGRDARRLRGAFSVAKQRCNANEWQRYPANS
jgi:hypothetical protein